MAQLTRTWWGRRFIEALERFTDRGRLDRGRSYAHNGRILEYAIANGKVTAKVRGSINPYFGVYKEPIYTTSIVLTQIKAADWTKLMAYLSSRAGFITKLLLSEMPDTIDDAFATLDLHLLPRSERDFTTKCSCPDWANPCKHVAGLCYVLANALDTDPFLLFELRGLSRERLHAELEQSPLGRILAAELVEREIQVAPSSSFHTRPTPEPAGAIGYKEFWTGTTRLPARPEAGPRSNVPALLIKKQGDFPPFWHKDQSFIGVMEELYGRVRAKSPQLR